MIAFLARLCCGKKALLSHTTCSYMPKIKGKHFTEAADLMRTSRSAIMKNLKLCKKMDVIFTSSAWSLTGVLV